MKGPRKLPAVVLGSVPSFHGQEPSPNMASSPFGFREGRIVRTLWNFSSASGHLFESPLTGPVVLIGTMDEFHEVKYIVIVVYIFQGRESKVFIKFIRNVSVRSILMNI